MPHKEMGANKNAQTPRLYLGICATPTMRKSHLRISHVAHLLRVAFPPRPLSSLVTPGLYLRSGCNSSARQPLPPSNPTPPLFGH